MVATDVASRGIGMVAIAPAHPSPPLSYALLRDLCDALLSILSCAFVCIHDVQGSFFFSVLPLGTLVYWAKLASLTSASLRTDWVQSRIGFLTCSSHISKVS